MALTQNVVDRLVERAEKDLDRAGVLYNRFALDGGTLTNGGDYVPLLQPDRRDAAQFIFFEAAAQFEAFSVEAFKIEVRSRFKVSPKRAVYLMGGIDRGLTGVMGWGAPKQLQSRGRALFGKTGFFGRLESLLGSTIYQRLSQAHKVRNRVAHTGGKASEEFIKILAQLGVPQASRSGTSVGRLLMDYPTGSSARTDRWFHRFIGAYKHMVSEYKRYMVI